MESDQASADHVKPPRYDQVAVLLLGWDPFFDKNGISIDFGRLRTVFEIKYGFKVFLKLLHNRTDPQAQCIQHVGEFVSTFDGRNTLLMVYFAASSRVSAAHGGRIVLSADLDHGTDVEPDPFIEWFKVERALKWVKADVLVVFDCSHAGLLCRDASRQGMGLIRYLGSCETIQKTHPAGVSSFTAALCWALEQLSTESAYFLTQFVHKTIEYKSFPTEQYPVLYTGQSGSEPIWFHPIPVRVPNPLQADTSAELDPSMGFFTVSSAGFHEYGAYSSLIKDHPHRTSSLTGLNTYATSRYKRAKPVSAVTDYGQHSGLLSSTASSSNDPEYGAYSSRDDDYSRQRTLLTGTGTQSSREPKDANARLDDDQVSDTGSIRTDGRTYDLAQATKRSLAREFADFVVENLEPNILGEFFDQQGSSRIVEDLVRDYAVLAGAGTQKSELHQQAVAFVRHQRRGIVSDIEAAATAWRPTADDQATLEEKLAFLHFGDLEPEQYEEPDKAAFRLADQEATDTLNAAEPEDISDDMPPLRDVVRAKSFLLGSQELPWLIERVRRQCEHDTLGGTYADVRSCLVNAIADQDAQLRLTLSWQPLEFARGQGLEGTTMTLGWLSDMVVYCGSAGTCYATTVLEYARRVWPEHGEQTIACVQNALNVWRRQDASERETQFFDHLGLSITMGDSTVTVLLLGHDSWKAADKRIRAVEVAETCVWLPVAVRANLRATGVGIAFPRISHTYTGLSVEVDIDQIQEDAAERGRCWFGMVKNPVIAQGYPVPKREEGPTKAGLELSIGLLAILSHADWVTTYRSTLLLRGIISALVPVIETATCLVWHFLLNTDLSPMTYEQACAVAIDVPHLTYADLENRRHFVGLWASTADVLAGGPERTMYQLHSSRSEPVNYTTLSWSSLSVSGGKFLTVGASFAIGNKDLSLALKASEARAYELQISDASHMTVMLYSSRDRRAWLVDGACALVHLASAWLQSDSARLKQPGLVAQLQHIQGRGRRSAAIDTLMANRELAIFADTETKIEESLSTSTTAGSDAATSDSGYATASTQSVSPGTLKKENKRVTSRWTYKALIYDFWRTLEAMKAKLDQLKKHGPEIRLHMPTMRPPLIGWDAVDLISNRFPLEPRYVRLRQEGKSWVDYAAEVSAVPLMAETFGELICPSPGTQICRSMTVLPKGRDLLAAPLSVLLLSAERFLRWEDCHRPGSARISDYTFLNGVDTASWQCKCKDGHQCRAISELASKAKKLDMRRFNKLRQTIFEEHPRGAVIIGNPCQRTWRWSSLSGRKPTVGLDQGSSLVIARGSARRMASSRQLSSVDVQLETNFAEHDVDNSSDESVYLSCNESWH